MWRDLWARARALWLRATAGSIWRQRVFAGGAALGLLLIISGVALAALAPSDPPQQRLVAQATSTATALPTATSTATPRPTATPKPKPVPKTPPPPPPATPTPSTSGGYTGGPVTNDSIFSDFCGAATPTATTAAPTATDTPLSATATPTGSATGTSTTLGHAGLAMPASCVTCPFISGYNSTQAQIAQALANAAATYSLPVNLLKAVAWQESHWHEDAYSCDGGIGLMQIQYYTYPWLNQQSVPECNIYSTSDDPYTLQGNANLGAKLLKYLACFWSYWGNVNGASLANPAAYTIDWYYQQAGFSYPDANNPNHLCATVFNNNAYYPALPSTTSATWSCPFSATAGDATLLDITVSSYNEGATNVVNQGINNWWYVNGVEGYIAQFSSGALP